MKTEHKELSFQSMVEASPVALLLVNNTGKIVYLNGYAERLFLYRKDELTGRDLGILLPEKYRSKHPALLEHYFKEPVTRQMGKNRELFALKKNGVEFPVEIGLNPIVSNGDMLVMAAVIDTTERKKAGEQFRLVVESAPNAIIMVDYSGTIIMINKQTEALFGYERVELIGEKMEILVPKKVKGRHPELRELFYTEPHARPMGAGRDLFGLRKDGREIPIEIGLNPLEKDGDHFVLASIIDITERKKTEEAIKLYTKRIEDKNKELEQFTFIASHDLREPLNSITNLTELLVEDKSHNLDEEALKKLSFIYKSSVRMTDLVKGLLDYARLGKNAEFKRIDLNEIVEIVVNDLEVFINESNAKIRSNPLPTLNVLEVEIRLLFQNIISNAIKYRNQGIDPEITVAAKPVKAGWEFAISDNGIGIPPDQYEKIFVIFQRLHGRNEYEGIGIGLSHCRKIVELHDGRIWVKSEPGKGSTFYFFLPGK